MGWFINGKFDIKIREPFLGLMSEKLPIWKLILVPFLRSLTIMLLIESNVLGKSLKSIFCLKKICNASNYGRWKDLFVRFVSDCSFKLV